MDTSAIEEQLAASRVRPRLTGLLRARLYPAERVHFDVENEAIIRCQALENRRALAAGSSSNGKFGVFRFAPPTAPDRDHAREAYNALLAQCVKVGGPETDGLSTAEFVYDTLAGPQALEKEADQLSAIQEVLMSFNKSSLGQLKHLASRLAKFDKGNKPAKKRPDATMLDWQMDKEYGSEMKFSYPLDRTVVPVSIPMTSAPENGTAEKQEAFFIHAKALLGQDASASSKPKPAATKRGTMKELVWFREQCEVHLVNQQAAQAGGASSSSAAAAPDAGVSMTVEELMGQLLETLEPKDGEAPDENALLELLGFEAFEFITSLLERRKAILAEWFELKKRAAQMSSEAAAGRHRESGQQSTRKGPVAVGPSITVMAESDKRNAKQQRKQQARQAKDAAQAGQVSAMQLLATIGTDADDEDAEPVKPLQPQPPGHKASQSANIHQSHFSGMGLKLSLPEGTVRKTLKGYERVDVPPAPTFDPVKSKVKYVDVTEMPKWAQVAFRGTQRLNTIQSIVFNAAFGRSQNLLICAPTGAGKTNIAILTILRLIGQHMDAAGGVGRDFKVIYMAPMKALVTEIAEKFQQRLGPLGVMVAELTGDMQLTKKELDMVHVIITVPEKWDVMTRNSACGGGVTDDSLQKLVQLIIIDEVHLLNDDRGAVIETVVARSLRYQETSGQPVRLVALSATLPNYMDVANFMRVEGENLFYFDSSYRPIPLETTFIGVTETNQAKKQMKFLEVCYDIVVEQVRKGHQCMVFVHSRGDTFKTAQGLVQLALDRNESGIFDIKQHPDFGYYKREVEKSRNKQVGLVFADGFGMHHAGMLRADRMLTEKMFLNGVVRVLCCTATLAWGVNLPARSVVIKGTSIFDSSSGGFKDLGILDVQQIFGRAGRPGFDTQGSATLITAHDRLNHYLRLLLQQMPIESRFQENMANSLNAEIAMGNIASEKDAAEWLRYTYLFVRFFRTPQKYGITQEDFQRDPELEQKRREFVNDAAEKLNNARLIRIDNNRNYNSTDLGRVAARFYVDWETSELFSKGTCKGMTDDRILALFGKAHEFNQLKVREDEMAELEAIAMDPMVCPIKVLGGPANTYGKVAILLQAYLSRRFLDSFSLVSDCNYVLQNASRLFRALFEITMTRVSNMSEMSDRLLEWCKMIDRRLWQSQHVLRHFCYPSTAVSMKKGASLDEGQKGGVLKEQIVMKLEEKGFDYWRIQDMTEKELEYATGAPANGKAVAKYMRRVPNLILEAKIQPITSTIMRITLILKPDFDWSDRWSGPSEPFYVWVENPESQDILHSEYYVLNKRNLYDNGQLSFAIPLSEPRPPQYVISVVSDRWVGVKFTHEFAVNHLLLPDRQEAHTRLLDLTPIPVTALHNPNYQKLYKFTHYNAIQTQVFHTCYHTDYNVLLGAPTGSGKTNVAELTMFRLFTHSPEEKVIYIAPLKALARERMDDWEERFQRQLGKTVVELTGDFTPDVDALERADVVVTTPEKWDGISRHWQHRAYVRSVGLIIIDEIHLLGQDRGPVLEVIVSRMRYISCNLDKAIRFVGLSTALANAHDIADWLGIGIVGLYNFKPSVRPVPMTAYIQGYPEKHYVPRMAQMNKPCYHAIMNHAVKADGVKPTLIFVSSRRQTRLTALDIVAFMTADNKGEKENPFSRLEPHELEYAQRRISDVSLKQTLEFGIGIHHAGLAERDRKVVEELFVESKIMVLISTSTLAWGVNFPAHLVIVKGTEYYDGQLKRYVDFPITDVLQMMGRAGRPQFDNEARAVIMVHEPKKNFYRRFIYEPFPVESSLHEQLTDHLNAEIVARTIKTREEAVDYVTWTYFFRRLTANPAYYDQQAALLEQIDFDKQRDMLANYIERLMNKCLDELIRSGCIELKEGVPASNGDIPSACVDATKIGRIASLYYLGHRTVAQFQRTLSRESMGFVELMRVLCECPEYDELPVRHNEDKLNAEFAEHCPLEVDLAIQAYDSPHTKAFLLLQAHMWGLALPINDYKTDLKSVLDRSIPLIQAMVDIAAEEAQLRSTLNLIILLQCLHQANHPWRSSLTCLPHFSDKALKALKAMGIESLPELIERKDSAKVLMKLSLPTADAHKEVLQLVQGLPRLRLRIELRVLEPEEKDAEGDNGGDQEGGEKKRRKGRLIPEPYKVPPDSELELCVVMQYDNMPLKFVHAPRFPKKKTFSWWCILGDTEVDELVSIKKAIMPTRARTERRVNFSFCSPADEVGETFTLSVIVMSDSWFGLDQQLDLAITTVAAEEAP